MLQIASAKLIHAYDIKFKRHHTLCCTLHLSHNGWSWKGFCVSSERVASCLCYGDAPEITEANPSCWTPSYLQVLCCYKPVPHIFEHEAFVLVPKDALSEEKEHSQMAGTLFRATGCHCGFTFPKDNRICAPSISKRKRSACFVFFNVCLAPSSVPGT